jgi:hypothetical protein
MGLLVCGATVSRMPDEPCWMCGAAEQLFRSECPECMRRWEDSECRELRERLFPPASYERLPE